jgi:hypothetical protein
MAQWPFQDRFKPQFDSWQLQMPSLTRRTEFEDGADRVRRTASFKPTRQKLEIDIPRRDLAVLRRWYDEEIDGGRLWFTMPAFVDDDYQEVEARIVDDGSGPFVVRPSGDHDYRVAFEIELRGLPRVDDATYLTRKART